MQRIRLVILFALLGGWVSSDVVADSPAQLVVGDDSIEALLRVPPDLPPGRHRVHCEASIRRVGLVETAYCYTMQDPAPESLVNASISAVRRAKFKSAVSGGVSVAVYAVMMILIDTTLPEPMVLAVMNNGVERQKYGLLYTAPQRILKNAPAGLRQSSSRQVSGEPDMLVWMQVQVDERGTAREFRLSELTGVSGRVLQDLEREVRRMKFLPGYYEGRPTAMLYVEPYFSTN